MENNGIGYLLKSLEVSPTKMAQVLNIDRTLISKWKSGARKVDINNEYFEKLLDYLIFYPLDVLLSLSKQPSITYVSEDLISHPPLILTQKQFKRHMQELAYFLLEHHNYNICLINSHSVSSLPSLHCWCKRNELLCLFDNNMPSHLMISENMSFINAIADTLERYYFYSPTEYTDKDTLANRLLTL